MAISPRRIGILGGSFNPIHLGHLAMAQGALRALLLERVLIIPANEPPHKHLEEGASTVQRVEMARRAVMGEQGLSVSTIEITRSGKSFTIDTLNEVSKLYPDAQLFLLVGSDMLKDLPAWKNAKAVMQKAVIACICRSSAGGGELEAANMLKAEYGADVRITDIKAPDISSSAVRAAIAKALPVKGLVPPLVENYIYKNALYVTEYFKSIQESCRRGLSSGRYLHTIGVMKTALELAALYGADGNKAKLAALLHDCGRSLDKGALSHAEKSELLAREKYQVADKEVLKAIRLHTTLDEGASLLDKIIYLADMIEPNRKFQGVEELRALAMLSLDKAVMEGLRRTIGYVKTRHFELSNKSQRALIWLEAELKLNPKE